MRRILRADAICLRGQDHRESSRLVTLLTREHGRIACIARGARRPRSRFGAALGLFARSRIIYYWRENRTLYTLSDAELVDSHSRLALEPGRFLAAGRMAEFAYRIAPDHQPVEPLFDLLVASFAALETAEAGFEALACSFLLKAASFAGFRPELGRCLVCRRPVSSSDCSFDPARGGVVCSGCATSVAPAARPEPGLLDALRALLYTPAAELARRPPAMDPTPLVLAFLRHHFDPLVLNSYRR